MEPTELSDDTKQCLFGALAFIFWAGSSLASIFFASLTGFFPVVAIQWVLVAVSLVGACTFWWRGRYGEAMSTALAPLPGLFVTVPLISWLYSLR